jgi:hypothetical protein
MAIDLRPGTWVLFRNQRRQKDTQPEYTGQLCLPDGRMMEIVSWVKEGKSGRFFSGKIGDMPEAKKPSGFR